VPGARLRQLATDPFAIFSALVMIVAVLIARQRPWVADFWLHAATVERLRENLWHPGNPVVSADTGSPYYSPYTWLLAVLAKLTGASAVGILTAWGPVNVAILLAGVWAFARRFGRSSWLPIALFVTMLLLWGGVPLGWSGFVSLSGLPLILSYPSTFAFGLTLIFWAALLALLERGATQRLWLWGLGLGSLAAVIVVSHQFTGVIAALGALAILAAKLPAPRSTLIALGLAVLTCGVLVSVWPYYSIFDLLGTTSILDGEHVMLYDSWRGLYGYAFVTLPFLALRWIRNRRDPLVLMFVAGAVPVAYGGFTGHWSWGRVIPLMLFAGQAATAFWVVQWLQTRPSLRGAQAMARVALVALVSLACLAGLRAQMGNLLHVAPLSAWPARVLNAARPVPAGPDYAWITSWARPGDVVLTDDLVAGRTIPAHGLYLVAPTWPDPLLADDAQRHADQASMLNPATSPAVRRQLLAKYHVRWILMTPSDALLPDIDATAVARGPEGQVLREVTGSSCAASTGCAG
jgi:alpha-1,6-mannosyltransferase